jgi:hypothetical protein
LAAWEVTEVFDENPVSEALNGEDPPKPINRAEFSAIAVQFYEKLSGYSAATAEISFAYISGNACEADILKTYNFNIQTSLQILPLSRLQQCFAAHIKKMYQL